MSDPLSPREKEAMESASLRARPITGRHALDAGFRQGWWAAGSFYTVVSDEMIEAAAEALEAETEAQITGGHKTANFHLLARAALESRRGE